MSKSEPVRKSMPIGDWPSADRHAWEWVTANGDLFDGRGPAAHWSDSYRDSVTFSYGRWLAHLQRHDPSSLQLVPAERVTVDRVREYVSALETEIAAISVHVYVSRLYETMHVMAAKSDWAWLGNIIRSLAKKVTPPNKRPRMVDSDRLFNLGIRLMDTANLEPSRRRALLDNAIQYRDGLIIALLAARPVRRRNLANITIGQQLLKVGDHFNLNFAAAEMKNGQPLEFDLPEALSPYMNRYLTEVRPKFPGAAGHEALCVSTKGGPMCPKALYDCICRRTRAAFGHAINPHLFRDCVATTIAIKDPAHVEVARDLLGHSRLETTERYYNQARVLEASRQYHQVILAERAQLAHDYPSNKRK